MDRNPTLYLLAGVVAVFALELLLVSMRFLVLKEAVALVEDGRAVAAPHLRGPVAVQVVQVHP